jgi:DNA-binding GntR family transcriptional regulator
MKPGSAGQAASVSAQSSPSLRSRSSGSPCGWGRYQGVSRETSIVLSSRSAFHISLYAGCTSPLLLDLADVLFDNAERYRRWAARWRQAPRRKHDEHQQLLKAVVARQSERAVELLRQHITHTEQLVAAALVGKGRGELQ